MVRPGRQRIGVALTPSLALAPTRSRAMLLYTAEIKIPIVISNIPS